MACSLRCCTGGDSAGWWATLAVRSVCVPAGRQVRTPERGNRFGFWSTTPISAKRRHAAAQNGLGRGLARHQRSGQPQKVLGARRGELQLEQRPSNASRPAGASRRFSPFSLFSPWPLFCLARPFRGSPRQNPTLHFAGTPPRQSQHPRGPTVRVWAKCNEGMGINAIVPCS